MKILTIFFLLSFVVSVNSLLFPGSTSLAFSLVGQGIGLGMKVLCNKYCDGEIEIEDFPTKGVSGTPVIRIENWMWNTFINDMNYLLAEGDSS